VTALGSRVERDEAGMAMITAVLVSVVVLFLGFVATGLSDHSFSSIRVDRKRVTAFHAAEAGLDHALQVLQSSAVAALPCGTPLARSLDAGAYAPDYVVTFTYYATYPVSGVPLSCPLTAEPVAAVVRSVGDSSDPLGNRRTVEATVHLSVPSGLGAFDRAVLSDQSIEYDGSVVLSSQGIETIVATNGSFNCDRPQQLQGSVHAQGAAALDHQCSIDDDLLAGGAITTADKVVIGGDVRSSTSSVTLSSTFVGGDVVAPGAITKDASSTVQGNFGPSTGKSVALPPARAFPALTYSAGAWSSAGYTPQNYSSCPTALADLTSAAAAGWGPTHARITGCRFDTTSSTTITVNADLAIVAEQGMNFAPGTKFTSSNGARLYLIVPSGSSCTGTAGRITMGIGTTFQGSLRVFAYTPCLLTAQNIGSVPGQLYGGQVRFGDFTMTYDPVASVPGYVPVVLNVARTAIALPRREVTS
jgi:hypothetical protein